MSKFDTSKDETSNLSMVAVRVYPATGLCWRERIYGTMWAFPMLSRCANHCEHATVTYYRYAACITSGSAR